MKWRAKRCDNQDKFLESAWKRRWWWWRMTESCRVSNWSLSWKPLTVWTINYQIKIITKISQKELRRKMDRVRGGINEGIGARNDWKKKCQLVEEDALLPFLAF
ncbi:unnamed protein product [Rhodiola kirilowii]